ncbi:hypothetical protein GCM10027091_69150 [Streptomyces daliensis]
MTDPRGVCACSAEELMPGVPYVRGWAEGRRGADALAEVLSAVGLDSDFPIAQLQVVPGKGGSSKAGGLLTPSRTTWRSWGTGAPSGRRSARAWSGRGVRVRTCSVK